MTQVLMVTGNPKSPEHSYSRRLGRCFMDAYLTAEPNAHVTNLDLYQDDIPLIDADVMIGWGKLAQQQELSTYEAHKVQRMGELVDQFLASDLVVFALPMWNFGYPPMVKAYMDAIAIAGKTFQYTAQGPVGLTSGKKAVILEARGGIWSAGPAQHMEHSQSHLRVFLGFLGVHDINAVFAEGLAIDPSQNEPIFEAAVRQAEGVARSVSSQPSLA